MHQYFQYIFIIKYIKIHKTKKGSKQNNISLRNDKIQFVKNNELSMIILKCYLKYEV